MRMMFANTSFSLSSSLPFRFLPRSCKSTHRPRSITNTKALTVTLTLTPFSLSLSPSHPTRNFRAEMSSSSTDSAQASAPLPPLPENRIVLGCGGLGLDYLATVRAYPKPEEKIRSTSIMVQGGGNAGNALTGAARLGLMPRLISKVANDGPGRSLLAELEADGVDASYIVVSEEGNSPFTYVIVDSQTKTRTCIHTAGFPPLKPDDLTQSSLSSALDGVRIIYLDFRGYETALVVAKEAARMQIPILVDSERKREGLDDIINLADYAVCSAKFPQAWTEAPSIPSALLSMLQRLPKIKFVIVTLGERGCIMLERNTTEDPESEEVDIDSLLESLKQKMDGNKVIPTCISSKPMLRLSAKGVGTVCGRLLVGTSEVIPPSELIDTTGAGDAFIGAILYAICADMSPEKMLPFAARVAAANCRALGARTGLPHRTDPRLAPFFR